MQTRQASPTYHHAMPPPQRPRRRRQLAGHHTRLTPLSASSSPPETKPPKTGPAWWVRDILVAGTVAILVSTITSVWTVTTQEKIDDARADRELRAANLTFVRERASVSPYLGRPFTGLDLRDQNLQGLHLQYASFAAAKLSGANLTGADLAASTMEYADLSNAVMDGATLTGVKLSSADLPNAMLRGAKLGGAELIGADLTGVDLRGADMGGADLRDADLTGVCWEHPDPLPSSPDWRIGATQWPQGFTPPPSTDTSCRPIRLPK